MEKQIIKNLSVFVLILLAILLIIILFNYNFDRGSIFSKVVSNADKIAPSVSITYPNDNDKITDSPLLVRGSASDDLNVKEVRIKVNDGNWETVEGTTSWSKILNLINGENTVYVQAFDSSDNASPVFARTFIYENLD